MADSSVQDSGKEPLSMMSVETILENARKNSSYAKPTGDCAKTSGSFKPSVSSSYSMVSSSPHVYSSGLASSDSYHYSSKDDSSVFSPCKSSCAMSFNENALTGSFDSGMKSNYSSGASNYQTSSKYSTTPKVPESTDDWVDYKFNILVTERKNSMAKNSMSTNTMSKNAYKEPKLCSESPHSRSKNVEDIIREYSISPSVVGSIGNNSARFSSAVSDRHFRSDWMNRSHNNEYLDSSNSEVEQVRRIGSSVDGKVGDTLENTFSSKCSLNNPRCKSGPGSSNMQLQSNDEYHKRNPEGTPSDSEVDSKEPPEPKTRDFGEIRTEMAELSYSFQKEKDRLRHLETLIKKTPVGAASSSTGFYQSRLSSRYSSRFLSDLPDKRTYSTTNNDYSNKFVTADWRSVSPHKDYVGRTTSSPTYKSFMDPLTPRQSSYWSSEYSSTQPTATAYEAHRTPHEAHRAPSTSGHGFERHDAGKPSSTSVYRYTPNDISGSKSKLNRSMNAKKDRTSPKINTSIHHRIKPKSSIKSSKSKISNRGHDQSANRKEIHHEEQNMGERRQQRSYSPESNEEYDRYQINQKSNKPKKLTATNKYQTYEPLSFGQYLPQRTKSTCSTTTTLSDPCRSDPCRMTFSEHNPYGNGQPHNEPNYNWQAVLDPNSTSQDDSYNESERPGRTQQPAVQRSMVRKKSSSKKFRSRSGGPSSVCQAWAVDVNPANAENCGVPMRNKKNTRKIVKTKTKKMARSASKPKRRMV